MTSLHFYHIFEDVGQQGGQSGNDNSAQVDSEPLGAPIGDLNEGDRQLLYSLSASSQANHSLLNLRRLFIPHIHSDISLDLLLRLVRAQKLDGFEVYTSDSVRFVLLRAKFPDNLFPHWNKLGDIDWARSWGESYRREFGIKKDF